MILISKLSKWYVLHTFRLHNESNFDKVLNVTIINNMKMRVRHNCTTITIIIIIIIIVEWYVNVIQQ